MTSVLVGMSIARYIAPTVSIVPTAGTGAIKGTEGIVKTPTLPPGPTPPTTAGHNATNGGPGEVAVHPPILDSSKSIVDATSVVPGYVPPISLTGTGTTAVHGLHPGCEANPSKIV